MPPCQLYSTTTTTTTMMVMINKQKSSLGRPTFSHSESIINKIDFKWLLCKLTLVVKLYPKLAILLSAIGVARHHTNLCIVLNLHFTVFWYTLETKTLYIEWLESCACHKADHLLIKRALFSNQHTIKYHRVGFQRFHFFYANQKIARREHAN